MTLAILHVLDHSVPLHSGYAFRTLAILREQRARGWTTCQLTSTKHYGATADEEEVDGFHFHRTRVPEGGWRALPLLDQLAVIADTERRLESVIEQTRPDVIHAHSPCLNGIAALRAGRRAGVPVAYEMRSSWEDAAVDYGRTREGSVRYRLSRLLETWSLRRVDAVTTICEGLREDIVRRGIAADRITVVPNAVDIASFPMITEPNRTLRQQLGLDGAFTLGFIGSFYGYEGLDILIAAMPAILRAVPNARLLLVGGGMEEARILEQIRALDLGDRVLLTGRVPHDSVRHYYSVMDLLVYPRKSSRLTETITPLKPLEAMAQGRLVIASDVGGHRELIRHGETGLLFRPDDPTDLARTVIECASRPERWLTMRSAARRFVETERTWSSSVARYAPVYERMCQQPRIR